MRAQGFSFVYKNIDTPRSILIIDNSVLFHSKLLSVQSESGLNPLIMHTHACPCTSFVLMPEEEEKVPGFSLLHMHLFITDPVHSDALKSHGRLSDVFTVELAWAI